MNNMTKKLTSATIITMIIITSIVSLAAVLSCEISEMSTENIRATQVAFMEQRNYVMATAAPYTPPPPAVITATAEARAEATVQTRERILERRRVARVIARERAEAYNKKSREKAASSHVNERYCQFRSDFNLKIIQHVLGIPTLDAETVLDCKFAISVAKNYLSDCEKTGTELWTRWKRQTTPVNHHVHTHDETSEQVELVIECRLHDVRTGIDVSSTQQMVIFMSDPDELCHSHPHKDANEKVHTHKHCHSHEDEHVGETEHSHGHKDHRHYERAYVN